MNVTETELVQELVKLERDYRAFARTSEYKTAEIWHPTPGGFMEKYQKRMKELQEEIATIH